MSAARLVASWFGAGFLPWAPGTWGSLAALPFGWAIQYYGGRGWLLGASTAVFLIGWTAAARVTRGGGDRDPGWIVIDEVVGQWLSLLALPLDLAGYAAAFLLFRTFDIWKPWPIRQVERSCGGGFGVMIDDVLAAIYALIVLAIGRLIFER
jgi:phosphatidylglycerophosphatase A